MLFPIPDIPIIATKSPLFIESEVLSRIMSLSYLKDMSLKSIDLSEEYTLVTLMFTLLISASSGSCSISISLSAEARRVKYCGISAES